ncbi:MAG: PQQ-binding-like beta-propeller repeat protein [bacterium]|nr:PQQ-binding-like beta-propeller repeat protein [bacterium]
MLSINTKSIFILLFIALDPAGLSAQLKTNAAWPMFRQNLRHTGQTNRNVLGNQSAPVAIWTFAAGGDFYSSPVVDADGTVYVGARDDTLYAITNGKIKWSFSVNNDFDSSPSIGPDKTIYIGNDNYNLYAVTNGLLKWSVSYVGGESSPSIGSNQTIYIGSENYTRLYAVTNGQVKWYFPAGSSFVSSPAIDVNNVVYAGCRDDNLYAITNGAVKWSFNAGSYFDSSPAIGPDGTVYVGCQNNYIYAVTNGAVKWSYLTLGSVRSSPAIGPDNTVYAGSDDSRFYAITNGNLKWMFTGGWMFRSSPAIGSDGTVYVGCYDFYLYAITNGVAKWSYRTDDYIDSSPAIGPDGTVYISSGNKLYAVRNNERPWLSWSSNTGYRADAVQLNTNLGGSYFRFEIKYRDRNRDKPGTSQVWIDVNDNSIYEEEEKFPMTWNSGSSPTNGMVYTNLTRLYYSGDGYLNYRFFFEDRYGMDCLTNYAVSNHIVRVTNKGYTPVLDWTGEAGYMNDGVNPNTNSGAGVFVFRVRYSNLNNIAPGVYQVWIDENDDGQYLETEKHDMPAVNSGDVNYTDGKDYTYTNLMGFVGDGIYNYRFHFADTVSLCTGAPMSNHIFVVLRTNVYYVKTNGDNSLPGTSIDLAWRTIQKAASTLQPNDRVYILAGTYTENVTNKISGTAGSNILFSAYTNGVRIYRAPGTAENAWFINGVNYIKVVNVYFTNNPTDGTGYGRGILFNSTGSIISNVEIYRFQNGMGLNGNSLKIKKSRVRNNGYGWVELSSLNSCLFQSNAIINNNSGGVSHSGGSCWDCINANVYNGNDVSHNGGHGFWFDFHGVGNRYLNNTIHSNNGCGIRPRDGESTVISNNSFIGNSGGGIGVCNWNETYIYIYRNYFYNNGNSAIANQFPGSYVAQICYNRIDRHTSYGIHTGCLQNNSVIQSNIIRGCNYGIYGSSSSVIIRSNIVYSNNTAGIYLDSSLNKIITNHIYRNRTGIYFAGCQQNYLAHNMIFSNTMNGIYLQNNSFSNFICTNHISGRNQSNGICDSGKANVIKANHIFQNRTNGIVCVFATNSYIMNNLIRSHPAGIRYQNSSSSVLLNTITNNNLGVLFLNGGFKDFSRNNLAWNRICSFSNASGAAVRITNNWWGSTLATNIRRNIFGMTGYSNFTPYRLFGAFDITAGADTDPPDRITGLMSLVSIETVKLSWNRSTNSDFQHYSIYRSRRPGTTNLSRSLAWTNISDVMATNCFDFPGNGMWYYTITALDKKYQYTNECWYSRMTNARVYITTVITVSKSISNIRLNSQPSVSIPGSTITYKITYSNRGSWNGDSVVVYDRISQYVTFYTEGIHSASGWGFEHSTDSSPDQGYDSADYIPGYPPDKNRIKWIRWKKETLFVNEDGVSLIYRTIIK